MSHPRSNSNEESQLGIFSTSKGQGYVYLNRSIADHPMWKAEPFSKGHALVDLLIQASWNDSAFYIRGNRVEIKRGQIGRSILGLAERWQWSRKKVTKFLNDLEKEQQIAQQKTSLTTLINIVNYESDQTKRTIEVTAEGTAEEQQRVQQRVHIRSNKDSKVIKGTTTPPNPPGGNGHIEFLDLFPIEFQLSELFRNEWKEWLQHLREKKKGLKLTAANKQAKFISKYPLETAIAVISRSIENNWIGLFEPKPKKETDEERRARRIQKLREEFGQ